MRPFRILREFRQIIGLLTQTHGNKGSVYKLLIW